MRRKYILDTNTLGYVIHDRFGISERLHVVRSSGAIVGCCPPILAEIYYGVENSCSREKNLTLVREGLHGIKIWPFDLPAAKEYGRIAAFLTQTGRKMQVVDMQLAAVALTLGNCVVVTTDSDLSAIPKLPVEDWTQPAKS